jgi:AcrR family transcriptional regulator
MVGAPSGLSNRLVRQRPILPPIANADRPDGRTLRYQDRRPTLLTAASEYVLDTGLHDLSLRRMATALGVTHATLIRHFGTKEALLAEVLEHLRRTLLDHLASDEELRCAPSASDQLRVLWARWPAPRERRQFLLLVEVYSLAAREPDRFGSLLRSAVHDWLPILEQGLRRDGTPEAQVTPIATGLLAQIRGLQLDLIATGDHARVDRAFEHLLGTLTR